ncbi:hypothetical protein D3C81_1376950 [compost metagenome]
MLDLLPYSKQTFVMGLNAIEIGAAYAHAFGPQLGDGTFDFLHSSIRLCQVGVAPEVEVLGVLTAVSGHFVVADSRILCAELACPVHEGKRGGGDYQLVHAPLSHQLTTTFMGHA